MEFHPFLLVDQHVEGGPPLLHVVLNSTLSPTPEVVGVWLGSGLKALISFPLCAKAKCIAIVLPKLLK